MTVMQTLIAALKRGDILQTPVKGNYFKIDAISENGVTLSLGSGWKTPIPANCWNGIPAFLEGKGWVKIGAVHSYEGEPDTLEDYINSTKPQRRSTGNYVAAVLHKAGLVEVDPNRPSKVRLL